MRIKHPLSILTTALMLATACSPREELSVAYIKQLQNMTGCTKAEEAMMSGNGLIEYDSVRFSDGSYAIHRLRYSPQNSLTEFFDSNGRTIATVARASECYAQTLVYGYDAESRLTHLLRYKSEVFDGLEPDSMSYGRNEEGYLAFRQMIADIDYARPDTARYEQTNIEYDSDGNATKAYVTHGNDSITAPSGYKLEVAVKPCLSFWQSDLNGGFYILHITLQPKKRGKGEYRVCRFADFIPSVESYYRNGYIIKTVWHHDPDIESDDNDLVFCPVREGALNVYTTTRTDGSKHQRAYSNGRLAYMQTISKYGTVLKKESYSFFSDNKVRVRQESIDYSTRTLKLQSVADYNVANPDKYCEDMNVISESYRWKNYYDYR